MAICCRVKGVALVKIFFKPIKIPMVAGVLPCLIISISLLWIIAKFRKMFVEMDFTMDALPWVSRIALSPILPGLLIVGGLCLLGLCVTTRGSPKYDRWYRAYFILVGIVVICEPIGLFVPLMSTWSL
jgi:hypothetical protein